MQEYMINIFVRVIQRKMGQDGRTATEILDVDYPNLTQTDKDIILGRV